jgi:hypothetical protein
MSMALFRLSSGMAKPATPAKAKKPKPLVKRAVKAAAPAAKKAIAKAVKKAVKKPARGRPSWEPTPRERRMIERFVASGFTRPQIARLMDKSEDTLFRHCKAELMSGDLKANAMISGALYRKALKGDTTAIIWWEKTRRGLSEKSIIEHQGRDGGPIETTKLTAKEAAEKYREKLG